MCALPQRKRGLENLVSSSSPRQTWEGDNERNGKVIYNPALNPSHSSGLVLQACVCSAQSWEP